MTFQAVERLLIGSVEGVDIAQSSLRIGLPDTPLRRVQGPPTQGRYR